MNNIKRSDIPPCLETAKRTNGNGNLTGLEYSRTVQTTRVDMFVSGR